VFRLIAAWIWILICLRIGLRFRNGEAFIFDGLWLIVVDRTGCVLNSMIDIVALGFTYTVTNVVLLVCHLGYVVDGTRADFISAGHLVYGCII